ncbi:MAG: deoxyribodipyrimidine photo-lyase [Saprospiraceae bacterium]|nr:deoxyribodipyrimidine photo-lyase [Saprospiraceae bacterium]
MYFILRLFCKDIKWLINRGYENKSILWFRQDLRIHDNEALYEAIKWNSEVIPVYVFDPRVFQSISRFGHRRMSGIRAWFIIESVHELRAKWREMGSDLIVRVGHPEEIIFNWPNSSRLHWCFVIANGLGDEVYAQDTLEKKFMDGRPGNALCQG